MSYLKANPTKHEKGKIFGLDSVMIFASDKVKSMA